MNEIWKPIKGFEDYLISNLGRIKSLPKNKRPFEYIIEGYKDHYGYKVLTLVRNKKKIHKKIHRLVAEAFIPNPENKRTIDHIDGNKANNYVNNLRWATINENFHNPITFTKAMEQNKTKIKHAIEGNFVYIQCLETGEVIKGINNLAKQLKCNRETIRFRLRDGGELNGFHYKWIKGGKKSNFYKEKNARTKVY